MIERKGAEVLVTRDCLSNLEGFRCQNMINIKLPINCKIKTLFSTEEQWKTRNFRIDIPADKYEGCRPANRDVKLGQYVHNRIEELDVYRWSFGMMVIATLDLLTGIKSKQELLRQHHLLLLRLRSLVQLRPSHIFRAPGISTFSYPLCESQMIWILPGVCRWLKETLTKQ